MLGRLSSLRWLLALGLAGTVVPVTALGAEATESESVSYVELPSERRWRPKATDLVGRTQTGHVVVDDELDPAVDVDASGAPVQRLMSPDGRSLIDLPTPDGPLQGPVTGVVGDRLVIWSGYFAREDRAIRHRLVGDQQWSTLALPEGHTAVDYTRDGVVLREQTQSGDALSLLPWSGAARQPITGLPAGASVVRPQRRTADDSLSLLPAQVDGDRRVVVDTATRTVRMVPLSSDACSSYGNAWSINDGVVAWEGRPGTDDAAVICTVDLSASGSTVSERPGVAQPSDTHYDQRRLLPVAGSVLVWTEANTPGGSLSAVGPDGGRRQLAAAVGSVIPSTSGRALAVTSERPGVAAIVDIDVATGRTTTARELAPVTAWLSGVAVDDSRVVTIDDSARFGAVRQRTVDFASGTAGASTLLDTDARPGVAAGEGGTAWSKSGWQGIYSAHRTAAGTVTRHSVSRVSQTGDRWVTSGGHVLDVTTGALRAPYVHGTPTSLQDGVTYVPGSQVPGGPRQSVVATDLPTRRASEIPVGCDVLETQVAGSWLLVTCGSLPGEPNHLLVDLTGGQPPRRFTPPGGPVLGNGFMVASRVDGELTWTTLAPGPLDGPWRPLATGAVPRSVDGSSVSVSRGREAVVAWVSGRRATAARLPGVVASPLPARPTAISAPSVPQVTAVGTDRSVVVRWTAPQAADQVRLWRAVATSPFEQEVVERTPDGHAAMTIPRLVNGRTYDVTLTAWNLAGGTTSRTVQVTPVASPGAPTDVQVRVDASTSTAHVTWQHAAVAGSEPVRSFSVEAGGVHVTGLDPSRRSLSVVVPGPAYGPVRVIAHGVEQESTGSSAPVSFPDPRTPPPLPADTTAPTASIDPLPEVSLSPRVVVGLRAADDRALLDSPVEVRRRTGPAGQALGAWAAVPGGERLPAAGWSVVLEWATTTCWSARSRDAAGNVSGWSPEVCTTTPVDDSSLVRTGPGKRAGGAQYLQGGATTLTRKKSALSSRGTVRNDGWLVATTCKKCGKVRVSIGRTSYGVISLASPVTHHQQLLRLPGPSGAVGQLRLTPMSKKPVTIDGVVLRAG